jgi:Tfp pilus assembly protein PilX
MSNELPMLIRKVRLPEANPTRSSFVIRRSPMRRGRQQREGMALLLCIFILSIITVWLVDMLDTTTTYTSALRNNIEYEQALYQANAGVHDAVAQLESNSSWVGTVTAGSYPASGSYSATAATGSGGTVTVISYGVAGATTRKVVATVQVQ